MCFHICITICIKNIMKFVSNKIHMCKIPPALRIAWTLNQKLPLALS